MRELKSLYDNNWISRHFNEYQKRIETTVYNYEFLIKEERERKNLFEILEDNKKKQKIY